jgi:hypothetical protein
MSTVDNALFDYSPITERPPIRWPGGARVAFYVGLNVEHFLVDRPSTSLNEATASLVPDPLNYGWRDYGVRVGIWRTIQSLDRHGMLSVPYSVELNDLGLFLFRNVSGPEFVQVVKDQFDQLHADAEHYLATAGEQP